MNPVLSIGAVQFLVRAPAGLVLYEPDEAYAPFQLPGTSVCLNEPLVSVRICVGGVPDVRKLREIFSGGQAWSLCGASNGERWVIVRHGDGSVLWAVRLNAEAEELTICCAERLVETTGGHSRLLNPLRYPLDQMLAMRALSRHEGVIVHSAGACVRGKAYVFAGRRGAGKTTLARSLSGSEEIVLLSDDRCVARATDGVFRAFGTPWAGEARIARNASAPIGAIFFLAHGPRNRVLPIASRDAFEKLLPVCSVPWYEEDLADRVLKTCERMVQQVPAYVLEFAPGADVADFLLRFAGP